MVESEHANQSEQQAATSPQQNASVAAPPTPSFNELLRLVIADANLSCYEKKILLNEVRKVGGVDRWTFRSAIWILGSVVLVTVVAVSLLTWSSTAEIPDGLIAIGSGAAGGLAGLLTPGRERGASS